MFSNVYEDPHFTTNMRYSKQADGGETVERMVDIYERGDPSQEPDEAPWTRDGGTHETRLFTSRLSHILKA